MKARNTIFLLIIAAGLFAFVRFYESKQLTTEEAAERASHVVVFDPDKIEGISITNNEEKIELRKRNSRWELDAPVKDRADEAAVQQLLTAVQGLKKETLVENGSGKDDVRDLGLEKPNVTLQLEGQDSPPQILFGKGTAIEGQEYIRLGNSNAVYVVADDLRNQVTKKATDFRDHKLSDLNATEITQANIKTAAGEIELRKDSDHWAIDKPVKARADDAKIGDLIAQLLNTKVDSFASSGQATASPALNDPQGTVTLTAEGAEKPQLLQLSKPLEKEPGKVYAKLSTRDSILVLSNSATAILGIKPNDVRDRHLIRLNLDTVDRIHLAPADAPEILLARKGEAWTIKNMNDRAANSGDVQKMAAALQNQQVTDFVSDVATDLPKYGLDHPQLKVTFAAYASETTAESNAGEEPLDTILFGKVDGVNVYAKLQDEPFIVSVPKSVLDGIYTDPLQWQDLAIYKLNPEEVTGLDVTKDGQATLSLVKEKELWKPAKGDIALNNANVQALASTLATLRAAQWVGAVKPDQGLDKPALTITFTTAGKKSYTVKIGNPAGEYWNASATGWDGTFALSKPDHDALTADLLPTAKSSASASAAAIAPVTTPGVPPATPSASAVK